MGESWGKPPTFSNIINIAVIFAIVKLILSRQALISVIGLPCSKLQCVACFIPINSSMGGLAVVGTACSNLMFPDGNLRARSLKVMVKGKAVLSAGSCTIMRNG